jgi:copper(I)-binding protein
MKHLLIAVGILSASAALAHHEDAPMVLAHHHDATPVRMAHHHEGKPLRMAQGQGHRQAHGATMMGDGPVANAALGPITIEAAFARAAANAGASSAAYMSVSIATGDDTLRGAASPIAARVELHTHTLDDSGVARMREVPGIEIREGSPTVLRPGGLHVMFMGLEAPLEEGATLPLTLTFEKAGSVTFDVPVRAMARRPMTN